MRSRFRAGTAAALLTLSTAIALSACSQGDPDPTLMPGSAFTQLAAGNTIYSDMAAAPGPPVYVFVQSDGVLVSSRRGAASDSAGRWRVNERDLFCIQWPDWAHESCGYVTDYHNGEYWWRGNLFRILPGRADPT